MIGSARRVCPLGVAVALVGGSGHASPAECIWAKLSDADREAIIARSPTARLPATRSRKVDMAARACGVDAAFGGMLAQYYGAERAALAVVAAKGGPSEAELVAFIAAQPSEVSETELTVATGIFASEYLGQRLPSTMPPYQVGQIKAQMSMPVADYIVTRSVRLSLEAKAVAGR